jgi:hypothetical protein
MKKIRIFRLNEWHPGAKEIVETIGDFINRGEEILGIPEEVSHAAIEMILSYFDGEELTNVDRESVAYAAIQNIENCIDTIIDNGYPLDWIIKEFRRIIQ